MIDQIKRAVVSVPSNIAEGAARNSSKEFINFLCIALGSLAELETQLIIAKKLGFLSESDVFDKIERQKSKMLGLIRQVKEKRKTGLRET